VKTTPLPALRTARTPRWVKWTSRLVLLLLAVALPVLAFTPWQQTVHGSGQVLAFNPVYRTQFLVSPIEGRVRSWSVLEGDWVKRGQRIAELIDNDPLLESRLEQERQSLVDRRQAAVSRLEQIDVSVSNLEASFAIQKTLQRTFVDIEMEQLNRVRQEEIDAQAALVAAEQNEKRMKELAPKGASERDVELAVRDRVQARARLESSQGNIKLRTSSVQAARDLLDRIDRDMQTAVSRENAVRESGKAELASAQGALIQIDVRIARQRAQYIESPCDGVVYRLLANAEMGGMLVRPGERLAMIVPDIQSSLPTANTAAMALAGGAARQSEAPPGIVAELFIDGNDLPLVRKGDRVRLQFEGWPAVQFASIPEAAQGTFAGRVYLTDPAANDRGQFRILVEPDPATQQNPRTRWPNEDYLRQGARTQGWVLLDSPENRVTLGWELWRMLNGFPVTRLIETKPKSNLLGPVR